MRTKTGVVTSAKSEKTVVVAVHRYVRHPKYHKRYRISKKFHAHSEGVKCKEGDTVVIQESRPLSKLKRWKVVEVKEAV
jgi:small subunit ribosomal protein S17